MNMKEKFEILWKLAEKNPKNMRFYDGKEVITASALSDEYIRILLKNCTLGAKDREQFKKLYEQVMPATTAELRHQYLEGETNDKE